MAVLYPDLCVEDALIRTLIITGIEHRLRLHGQTVDRAALSSTVDAVLRGLALSQVKTVREDIVAACTASMLKTVQPAPDCTTIG